MLEQSPTVPMLHVLTFRPEFEEPGPRRSHMTPITLNRLERPQVEALITHRAGGKTLPAEVVSHIVAKTDGVPLYVEELTKMLLGGGGQVNCPGAGGIRPGTRRAQVTEEQAKAAGPAVRGPVPQGLQGGEGAAASQGDAARCTRWS